MNMPLKAILVLMVAIATFNLGRYSVEWRPGCLDNLSLRMACRRFTQLINAFSKQPQYRRPRVSCLATAGSYLAGSKCQLLSSR
jgi:hypothetical protein